MPALIPDEELAKSGVELFRELKRRWSEAEVEDYYKAATGEWSDEAMRIDIQIIAQHRLEAGAEDIPELEEVELPELPDASPINAVPVWAMHPVAHSAARMAAKPPAGIPGLQNGTELRAIALFVAKFKLDGQKTKQILSPLTAARKQHIIKNFSTTDTGAAGCEVLQAFVSQCEEANAWRSAVEAPWTSFHATGAAAAAAPVTATPPRPATPVTATPPRPVAPVTVAPVRPASAPVTATPPRPVTAAVPALRQATVVPGRPRPVITAGAVTGVKRVAPFPGSSAPAVVPAKRPHIVAAAAPAAVVPGVVPARIPPRTVAGVQPAAGGGPVRVPPIRVVPAWR
eukprot:TRINITY_DN51138_c0_g1_i1.p1 TRINITY_DN51138_c0_g1~~TRINITY_DN51138_c0_g1_i1.p1  ORF type:complete len:343 (-),score=70.04 TRINITY_DN51138_c0_g1_i1:106-1134(-)